MTAPRIALALGDPAGIGGELAARLIADEGFPGEARVVVIGDRRVLRAGEEVAGLSLDIPVFAALDDALAASQPVVFHDTRDLDPQTLARRVASAAGGRSALGNLAIALDLAREGRIEAITFTPLNKQALKLGGNPFPDELGFMLDRLGIADTGGEFNIVDDMWNARVTSHVPLSGVCELITEERVLAKIALTVATMQAAGIAKPRIAVAALNPHAGEGGAFGHEDDAIIAPAVEAARARGYEISGPYPSDTVFLRARDGLCDAVLTMYHDQGQIAIKLLGFERGVTLLAGLTVPITTPAHGTAYDIVGSGVANLEPTRRAFSMGRKLASAREALRATASGPGDR